MKRSSIYTRAQRVLERISSNISEPAFLVLIWMAGNLLLFYFSMTPFDLAPFHFLQGIISLCALIIATIVLSNQNRLGRLEEQGLTLILR